MNVNNQLVSDCKLKTLKNKKAFVWDHFGVVCDKYGTTIDSDHYYCDICFKQGTENESRLDKVKRFKTTTATSNLSFHLLKQHDLQSRNEGKIDKYFKRKGNPATLGYKERKEKLTKDIALWFCQDLIAFEKCDSKGFHRFMTEYKIVNDPSFIPSSRNVAINGLKKIFLPMKEIVKNKINPSHGALTADMWTDSLRRSKYIGVTYHFFDETGLHKLSLGTICFPESHTSDNIYIKLQEICNEYGVELNNTYVVRDCGANIVAACERNNIKSHSCIGHGIHNLITVDGFKKVQNVMILFNKMKEIHSSLRYKNADIISFNQEIDMNEALSSQPTIIQETDEIDTQNNELFEFGADDIFEEVIIDSEIGDEESSYNNNNRQQHVTLKNYCPTRWHSLLAMSHSMLVNSHAINGLVGEIDRWDLVLTRKDISLIEALTSYLKKFKDTVDLLCADKYPTINHALVMRCQLSLLLQDDDDDLREILELKREMRRKFDQRFPLTDLIIVASLLDPKFKELSIIYDYCSQKGLSRKGFLRNYYSLLFGVVEEVDLPHDQPDGVLTQLALKFSANYNHATDFDLEIDSYLQAKDTRDVLDFWIDRKNAWPKLFKLARAILCVPATSVPVERLFSIAGLALNKKRYQLNPQKLDKILFIHDNYDFVFENCTFFDN